jgi:hypothetical protein
MEKTRLFSKKPRLPVSTYVGFPDTFAARRFVSGFRKMAVLEACVSLFGV